MRTIMLCVFSRYSVICTIAIHAAPLMRFCCFIFFILAIYSIPRVFFSSFFLSHRATFDILFGVFTGSRTKTQARMYAFEKVLPLNADSR